MNLHSRQWLLLSLLLTLASCASTGPAPVEDLNAGRVRKTASPPAAPRHAVDGNSHRVERGDTLYSIAFRNGLDYRELAAWNRIGPPYTIHVGQNLRLTAPARNQDRATLERTPRRVAGSTPAVPSRPAVFEPVENTPPAFVNRTPAATTSTTAAPAAKPDITPASTNAPSSATATATPAPAAVTSTPPAESAATVGEVSWRWPATGTLVGAFVSNDKTRQGIDIAGKAGDAVRAAADGVVVYSGNGLVGYGELIIIKHNASYLSAYGHNRKRMVAEGGRVKAGQEIAEMGSSSASRDSLHFEIRKNGKPVNPLDYLPRR
ncbi:peptidoglycan DD-metalloendopeptidase family protein [Dokdonella sp.]|uniref:peptidoglycan DD-metalloendopeptidase family protein n=1 Tax=Dokdonella sp. TaxID=2291710 RepID=UPI0025C22D43|nr:peptidoglycan DD-metalloendopeptidase family protein [Dokdonella sp.]MBX3688102.1 peptidoglycan DD-metalloendopeptidase family protein [Dokdonella sp.]